MKEHMVKVAVRKRDGHRCVECSMTARRHIERYGRTLEVHRIEPGSIYAIDGCVTLCKPCHVKKKRPSYYKAKKLMQILSSSGCSLTEAVIKAGLPAPEYSHS